MLRRRRRLAPLPLLDRVTQVRALMVVPFHFDEHLAAGIVPRPRDRRASLPTSAGVFPGDEARVARELSMPFETAPIPDLRGEDHHSVERDLAETLEARDCWSQRGQLSQVDDLAIELVPSRRPVLEERQVLAEHQSILRREDGALAPELLEPPEVTRRPVGAITIHLAAPCQELKDAVPRLEKLAFEGLPAADEVPHALLRCRWNADRREFTRAMEPREVGGVALAVPALHPWLLRDQ